MSFSKDQINRSKLGMHHIRLSPHQDARPFTVHKVHGQHVWVKSLEGNLVKLNNTASHLLMTNYYRHEPGPTAEETITKRLQDRFHAS